MATNKQIRYVMNRLAKEKYKKTYLKLTPSQAESVRKKLLRDLQRKMAYTRS